MKKYVVQSLPWTSSLDLFDIVIDQIKVTFPVLIVFQKYRVIQQTDGTKNAWNATKKVLTKGVNVKTL